MRVATWPASMCLRSNRRCSPKWLSCASGVGSVRGVVVASTSILTGPLPRNLSTIGWLERRGADIGSESHISCPDRRQAFMPDTCKGHRFRGKWRPMEQYQVLRKVARRKDCRETSAQEVEIEE